MGDPHLHSDRSYAQAVSTCRSKEPSGFIETERPDEFERGYGEGSAKGVIQLSTANTDFLAQSNNGYVFPDMSANEILGRRRLS